MQKLSFAMALCVLTAFPAVSGAAQLRPLATTGGKAGAPLVRVQADGQFRVNQLEEQVRQLNGQIEELNFQILQMQEQLRKIQEDNEFRFQEIEDKLGRRQQAGGNNAVASADGKKRLGKLQASEAEGETAPSDVNGMATGTAMDDGGTATNMTAPEITNRKSLSDLIGKNGGAAQKTPDGVEVFDPEKHGAGTGAPPAPLGSLVFDQNGNVVDSNVGRPIDLLGNQRSVEPASPDNPSELFSLGYQYIQGGQYDNAARTFNEFAERYPGDPRLPEALFWEGESHFSLGEYEDAARIFLKNHKANPDSELAAENLLKLGISLAGMNQRELACATYAEVPKKYPRASNAVRSRLKIEQANAKCVN